MIIQEFPLAWRWTQATHSALPADVLARIRPMSASEAACIRNAAPTANASSVVSRSAADADDVRQWLRGVQPDATASVYISWRADLAVQTTWDVFSQYWDDFCYPSSDDVTIAPCTGTWCLCFIIMSSSISSPARKPNKPAAGKAGVARLLTIEQCCPGLPEPGRSAAKP